MRAPQANAYCERLIGTMRRGFLDFVIPLSERYLRSLLKEWVAHYNQSRAHIRALVLEFRTPRTSCRSRVVTDTRCQSARESWLAQFSVDYTMSIDLRKWQRDQWR